jgi:hypothetical protein
LLEYEFLLSTQFLDYTFKWGISWPAAAIQVFSTGNQKKKNAFQLWVSISSVVFKCIYYSVTLRLCQQSEAVHPEANVSVLWKLGM